LEAKSVGSSARISFLGTEFAREKGLELWRVWGFERRRLKRICEVCFVQCGELMHLTW